MTTTAKTDLVNKAMAHLGEPAFTTIDTDPPGAALAKVLGQLDGRFGAERIALARHPWLCALSYASLSAISPTVSNWKWQYGFLLPDTFVKMWVVDGDDQPFEVGTLEISTVIKNVVWANVAALDVCYTEQKGFEAYTPDFGEYMALLLASKTAGPLKSDYEAARRLAKEAGDQALLAMSGEAGQYKDQDEDLTFAGGFAAIRASAP